MQILNFKLICTFKSKNRTRPVQKLGNPNLEGLSLRLNDMRSDSPPPRYFVLKSAAKDYTTFEFLTNLQFQIPCPQFHCEFPSNGCRFRKCVYAKSSKRA